MSVAIIIPTWNNLRYLIEIIRSVKEKTRDVDYRLIVVPNGCNDGTEQWLLKNDVQFVPMGAQAGFVKATNAGLALVEPDEHVLLLNDDTKITDPYWLKRMVDHFDDPGVGAVGPTSNFILGTQDFRYNNLPMAHEAPFLIGLCMLIRSSVYEKLGKLDESYGIGTNEDLDYSLAIRELGYKLIVDRTVFVWHFGSRSLMRVAEGGNIDLIQFPTRETLKKKWGEERVSSMFREMHAIIELSKSLQGAPC